MRRGNGEDEEREQEQQGESAREGRKSVRMRTDASASPLATDREGFRRDCRCWVELDSTACALLDC